eukprot:scaffold266551_cov17-Tisochrysis_lutea.AAC.2
MSFCLTARMGIPSACMSVVHNDSQWLTNSRNRWPVGKPACGALLLNGTKKERKGEEQKGEERREQEKRGECHTAIPALKVRQSDMLTPEEQKLVELSKNKSTMRFAHNDQLEASFPTVSVLMTWIAPNTDLLWGDDFCAFMTTSWKPPFHG